MKESIPLVDAIWSSIEPGSPLLAALGELSPQGQRAIFLRFWENFTIEEIATELRLSWECADRLVEDSVSALRQYLSKYFNLLKIPQAG